MYSLLENDAVLSIPGAVSLARELFTDFFPSLQWCIPPLYFSRIKLFFSPRGVEKTSLFAVSVQGIDEVSRI